MTSDERRLVRHLALAVAVKLLLLAGLWWAFVRDVGVAADAARTADHIGVATPPAGDSR